MKDFNNILKNVLVFFIVFLGLNYILQSCQSKDQVPTEEAGNIVFQTTKTEFNKTQTITLAIKNYTEETITIPSECPDEPFDVYRFEQNKWQLKTASPELNCENSKEITLNSGDEIKIPYTNWNHALFSDMGRFRIEFNTTINGAPQTFTTPEFRVVEESVFKKIAVGLFYRPIYNGLIFIVSTLPNHSLGFAIILLTLIIRTILLVPSQKAIRSQKRLQEIQPRLDKIKEKYKGDQQRIAMETMNIWKEAKINPLSSCFPLLLQFPFLIALFYVVKGGLNPDSTFLFYTDYSGFTISDINVNFLNLLDLTKVNLYVLPLIVGGLQFLNMKLTMGRKKTSGKQQQAEMAIAGNMMSYIMPVMIAVFTASLPSAIGIYWGTSTSYGIVQQIVVNRSGPKKSQEPTVRVVEN